MACNSAFSCNDVGDLTVRSPENSTNFPFVLKFFCFPAFLSPLDPVHPEDRTDAAGGGGRGK